MLKDFKNLWSVVRRLLRFRKTRSELAALLAKAAPLAPGSIKIGVYFADTSTNLYQMRQWYGPLAELSKTYPVAVIARSPSSTLQMIKEAPIPVQYLRKVGDLEQFVEKQDLKIIFYVNQNAKNFQMFRYGRMWHVFINHGESDKMYMTTNQFKAYDYSFIAGDAARDRLKRKLWAFDLDRQTLQIGRPQADHFAGALPYTPDERTVVLYAPTWEGDRAAAAYGSIATHGVTLVGKLLATGKHRVIYRPHPRSGVLDSAYRAANKRIIADIAAANAADPTAHHVFDDGPELGWQLASADVAISDVSAMVYDRLATGKPLLIARPASPAAEIDETGYLGHCEWVTAETSADIVGLVERVQTSEDALHNLQFWVERHFGDTTPGAATARFHGAVETLVAEWEKHAAIHAEDRFSSESSPFDSDDDEEGGVRED